MKLSQITALNSDRGQRSAISALMFSAKQKLLSSSVQHERMTRTVFNLRQAGYNDRADDVQHGKAYRACEERTLTAADELATLDVIANSLGLNIDLEIEPTMRRLMDEKQLELAAKFSGVDADEIKSAALKSAKTQFEAEKHAAVHAQSLFYTANGCDDIEVKAETVLNALTRERGRILTFSNILPYLGELALLKTDIETVEHIVACESEHDGENNGSIDNMNVVEVPEVTTPRRLKRVKKEAATADE